MKFIFDFLLSIVKYIIVSGKKLSVCITAIICMTILGITQMTLLKTELSNVFWFCFTGIVGFFFGFNIIGDHIFDKDKNDESCRIKQSFK